MYQSPRQFPPPATGNRRKNPERRTEEKKAPRGDHLRGGNVQDV